MADYRDEQDNPGLKVPPPLIYLLPLVLGLAFDRRAHVTFLPRRAARALGWRSHLPRSEAIAEAIGQGAVPSVPLQCPHCRVGNITSSLAFSSVLHLSSLSDLLPPCAPMRVVERIVELSASPQTVQEHQESFLATTTTARFFAFLPPREAIFPP